MNIITKATPTKSKLMLYGLPGVGKSSLAATLPKPLFIDVEGGLNLIDAPRTETLSFWYDVAKVLTEVYKQRDEYLKQYQTIVIDSLDWLVRRFIEHSAKIRWKDETGTVHKDYNATLNGAGGGYGKGKQLLANEVWSKAIPLLQQLNNVGFGICLIAHAERKEMLEGDGTNYERIVPKIEPSSRDVFIEWVDSLFYIKKDSEGKRTLLLESDDIALAKNRLGRTGEVDLSTTSLNNVLQLKEGKA